MKTTRSHTLSFPIIGLLAAGCALAGPELKTTSPLAGISPDKLEGPEFADVDGDGKKDLLSGLYSGNLLFRKNTGTATEPEFASPVPLQSGGKDIKMKHW